VDTHQDTLLSRILPSHPQLLSPLPARAGPFFCILLCLYRHLSPCLFLLCTWLSPSPCADQVALQFPEGLLMYACTIADILQEFAGEGWAEVGW